MLINTENQERAQRLRRKQQGITIADVYPAGAKNSDTYFNILASRWESITRILALISNTRIVEGVSPIDRALDWIDDFFEEVKNRGSKSRDIKTSTIEDTHADFERRFLAMSIDVLPGFLGRVAESHFKAIEETSIDIGNLKSEIRPIRAELEENEKAKARLTNDNTQLQIEIDNLRNALQTRGLEKARGAFQENANKARTSAIIAGLVTLAIVAIFFKLKWVFYYEQIHDLPENELIYKSVVRFLAASALASLMFLAIQITRAYLHLRERNLHRVEVSNTFDILVGATSEENRDKVLMLMIGALVEFGDSSLASRSDQQPTLPVQTLFDLVKGAGKP